MPPRKSTDSVKSSSKTANVGDDASPIQPSKEPSGMGVEDLGLPRSMIQRLAKGVLPPNTQIQKDALLAVSKSATVFVNYLGSYANERAMVAGKKTVQPKDVLDALSELEFENFLPRCETELQKYNAIQCDKRNTYRRKVRDEKRAAEASVNGTTLSTDHVQSPNQLTNGHAEGLRDDEPPAAKKVRTSLNPLHNGTDSQINEADDVDGAENDSADEDDGDLPLQEDEDDRVESEDEDDSEPEEFEGERLEEDPVDVEDRQQNMHENDEGSESD